MSKALEVATLAVASTLEKDGESLQARAIKPDEDVARAAILAFLREVDRQSIASVVYPIPNRDHADAHRIANKVLAALTRLAEEGPAT